MVSNFYKAVYKEMDNHPLFRRLIIVLIIWLIGILLIFQNLGYPRAIVFDETYWIPTAQSYINGVFFQNAHPPLGPIFIALGQVVFHPSDPSSKFSLVSQISEDWPVSDDISGYRIFPALFGTFNPVLVFCIVLLVTSSESLALFAALAILFDNALITESRVAIIDIILVSFCLMTILCFSWLQSKYNNFSVWEKIVWGLFGIVACAACMIKLTGLFVIILVPCYFYILWLENRKRESIAFLVIFGIAFFSFFVFIWNIHFSLLRKLPSNFTDTISPFHLKFLQGDYEPNPVDKFLIEIQDAYNYMDSFHENVPTLNLGNANEIGSPWYYWPFGGRAIPYRWEVGSGRIKIIYLIGNPVTWLISFLGVVSLSASVVADLLFQFLSKYQKRRFYPFFLLYWVYMLSVAFIPRVMYLYHYLPPMVLGVIMFGLMLVEAKSLPRKTQLGIMVVSVICLLVAFQLYSPLTYYKEIPVERLQQLNVLPVWNLRCPGC